MPAREVVEAYLGQAGFARIETRRLAHWIEDEPDPMIAINNRTLAAS